MSDNDINKPLEELYPNLCWDKSMSGMMGLMDTEEECSLYFVKKYSF